MFDAAGRFACFRVEDHGKDRNGTLVVLASSAHVADPGREILNRDQFLAQPRKVGDVAVVHDACGAFAAWYGTACEF